MLNANNFLGVQQPVNHCFKKIELLNEIKTMRYNRDNIPRVLEIINKLPMIRECFESHNKVHLEQEEFHFVFEHLPSQFLKESEVCEQTFTNLKIKPRRCPQLLTIFITITFLMIFPNAFRIFGSVSLFVFRFPVRKIYVFFVQVEISLLLNICYKYDV